MMKKSSNGNGYIATILRFLLACLMAGTILSLFVIRPIDVIVYILKVWRTLVDMGWNAFGGLGEILLLGAMIIGPFYGVIWLINTLSSKIDKSRRITTDKVKT